LLDIFRKCGILLSWIVRGCGEEGSYPLLQYHYLVYANIYTGAGDFGANGNDA